MPGNSVSRLPSGPICFAPCVTARSTGFATNEPTEFPSGRALNRSSRIRKHCSLKPTKLLLIAEAVSQLPDRCREVFRKSREEGLSNAAIANQMRISVKTVEAQITKALRRIRETLLRT